MKKILALILAMALSLTLVACGGGSNPSGGNDTPSGGDSNKTYTLQMTCNQADLPVLGDYQEKISKATNGRVTIEFVDLTSLGTPPDALGMVRDGTIDIYYNSAAQTGSDFPVMDVFQLPFYSTNPTEGTDMINAVWRAGYLDKELADFQPMFMYSTDMQMIFSAKPVSALSDLAGKKIRATSGVGASLVERIGATVMTMPLGDVYLSLDTGVVDAAMSSPVMIRSQAFNECAPYLVNTYLFGGVIMMIMNKDTWNSLPADIQTIFLEVNEEHANWSKWQQTEAMLENIDYLTSNGMTLVDLSEADVAAMQAACEPLTQEWINKVDALGYNGQEIIDYIQTVLSYYRLGM